MKRIKRIQYEINEPVLLNWTKDMLDDEDLGMSGIVLESPFKDFNNRGLLNATFYYSGTMREDADLCVISYKYSHDGKKIRDYIFQKSLIKKHYAFEKIGHEWFYKLNTRY